MGPAPQKQSSRRARRLRGRMTMAVGGGVVALALVAAGCSSSSTSTTSGTTTGTKVKGGTAVYALPPSSTPNYIFPMTSSAYISVYQLNTFAQLMYRPLYWFGNGSKPLINPALSLANEPTWSGNTATITLKHYMWSDGTPVTTTDVMFWLNMLKAVGADRLGRLQRVPGRVRDELQGGLPDRAADDHEQGLLAQLVPVQRPVPDHPDATGVGQDRVRAQQLRDQGERLRGGVQVPGQPGQVADHATCPRRCGRSWTARGSCPRSTPTGMSPSCRTRSTPGRSSRASRSSRRCRSPRTRPSTTCCARRPPVARRSTWATCRRRTPSPSPPGPARSPPGRTRCRATPWRRCTSGASTTS